MEKSKNGDDKQKSFLGKGAGFKEKITNSKLCQFLINSRRNIVLSFIWLGLLFLLNKIFPSNPYKLELINFFLVLFVMVFSWNHKRFKVLLVVHLLVSYINLYIIYPKFDQVFKNSDDLLLYLSFGASLLLLGGVSLAACKFLLKDEDSFNWKLIGWFPISLVISIIDFGLYLSVKTKIPTQSPFQAIIIWSVICNFLITPYSKVRNEEIKSEVKNLRIPLLILAVLFFSDKNYSYIITGVLTVLTILITEDGLGVLFNKKYEFPKLKHVKLYAYLIILLGYLGNSTFPIFSHNMSELFHTPDYTKTVYQIDSHVTKQIEGLSIYGNELNYAISGDKVVKVNIWENYHPLRIIRKDRYIDKGILQGKRGLYYYTYSKEKYKPLKDVRLVPDGSDSIDWLIYKKMAFRLQPVKEFEYSFNGFMYKAFWFLFWIFVAVIIFILLDKKMLMKYEQIKKTPKFRLRRQRRFKSMR